VRTGQLPAAPRPAPPAAVPAGQSLGALARDLERALEAAGVPRPRTEARDLVAALLDRPRFWAALHGDDPVTPDDARRVREALARRLRGAPFAYAVERAAFRYLTLRVDQRVLIPRCETEQLVDLVLKASRRAPGGVAADVGTGSGAIALALASEGHFERVIATDISLDALAVAAANVGALEDALRAPVELRSGSFTAPLRGERLAVLVSNPPYIAPDECAQLPRAVRDWEPPVTLSSSDGGLHASRTLIASGPDIVVSTGLLALEVDSRRAGQVAAMAREDGRWDEVAIHRDLSGRDRFVTARRR
jgi:release factor glutamine methyltransferase